MAAFWHLAAWLAALAALFVPLERVFALHPAKTRRSWAADVGCYFLSGLLPSALLALPTAGLVAVSEHVVPGAWRGWIGSLPIGIRLPLALVVGEVGAYWGHRLSHQVPWLWRFHALHHAPTQMNWLVHTRVHPVDMVFVRLAGLAPIFLFGLAAPGPAGGALAALASAIAVVWGFAIHANLRWRFGILEHGLATPFFHHWHHSRCAPLDRNYAAMFPWVDRCFGTLHLPAGWPEAYGTDTPLPAGLAGQMLRPLLPARWWRAVNRHASDTGDAAADREPRANVGAPTPIR